MAWPASPLTSYSAGTAPAIKAFDLNSIQSGINGIINGTYSLAAVVVDGTGGSVVAPTGNTIQVGAGQVATMDGSHIAFTGVTNPVSSTNLANQVWPITQVKAWATVRTTGGVMTLHEGAHVSSVSLVSATLMEINFASNFATTTYALSGSGFSNVAGSVAPRAFARNLGNAQIQFIGFDLTAEDCELCLMFTGRQA